MNVNESKILFTKEILKLLIDLKKNKINKEQANKVILLESLELLKIKSKHKEIDQSFFIPNKRLSQSIIEKLEEEKNNTLNMTNYNTNDTNLFANDKTNLNETKFNCFDEDSLNITNIDNIDNNIDKKKLDELLDMDKTLILQDINTNNTNTNNLNNAWDKENCRNTDNQDYNGIENQLNIDFNELKGEENNVEKNEISMISFDIESKMDQSFVSQRKDTVFQLGNFLSSDAFNINTNANNSSNNNTRNKNQHGSGENNSSINIGSFKQISINVNEQDKKSFLKSLKLISQKLITILEKVFNKLVNLSQLSVLDNKNCKIHFINIFKQLQLDMGFSVKNLYDENIRSMISNISLFSFIQSFLCIFNLSFESNHFSYLKCKAVFYLYSYSKNDDSEIINAALTEDDIVTIYEAILSSTFMNTRLLPKLQILLLKYNEMYGKLKRNIILLKELCIVLETFFEKD